MKPFCSVQFPPPAPGIQPDRQGSGPGASFVSGRCFPGNLGIFPFGTFLDFAKSQEGLCLQKMLSESVGAADAVLAWAVSGIHIPSKMPIPLLPVDNHGQRHKQEVNGTKIQLPR